MKTYPNQTLFYFLCLSFILTAVLPVKVQGQSSCKILFEVSHSEAWTSFEVSQIDPTRDVFNGDGWKIELTPTDRHAGGSQGGRWYIDKQNRQWFGKDYDGDISRMMVERLANRIYAALGVRVPLVKLVKFQGKPLLISEEAVGVQAVDEISVGKTDVVDNFVVDAFLANWDVLGSSFDNILQKNLRAVRLDQGGTLFYRAMGGLKEFSETVPELDQMRNPNYSAGRVFSKISAVQIAGQIRRFIESYSGKKHWEIKQLILGSGLAPAVREKILKVLDARFFWIVNSYLPKLLSQNISKNVNAIEWATEEIRANVGEGIWKSQLDDIRYKLKEEGVDLGPLSDGEIYAIAQYAGGEYAEMNNALRGQPRDSHPRTRWLTDAEDVAYQYAAQAPLIFLVEQGLTKLPDVETEVTRIADFPPEILRQYQVGKIITEKGFTSTTRGGRSPAIGNVTFSILSKHGKFIGFLNRLEAEVLFRPNTRFKILKKTKGPDNQWFIRMIEQ